jgi:quinol-cytochrome oxidoreductase complex cytochrome b subunit
MAIFISIFIYFAPAYLGHPDNSIPANPLVTPASIVPEWYVKCYFKILLYAGKYLKRISTIS